MSENSKDPFVREPRYVVFKLKDISAYLDDTDCRAIERIGEDIAMGRRHDGKPPFNAVVVEQDWPEFDLVWSMIEARMTGAGNDHRRHSACVDACRGIPTEKLDGIAHAIGERASELIARAEQRDELLAALQKSDHSPKCAVRDRDAFDDIEPCSCGRDAAIARASA